MAAPMSVFDIAGRAMSAQIVRLNTVASNMANAGTVSTTKEGAYRALEEAAEDCDPTFCSVAVDPLFADFHAERRFAEMLARRGLEVRGG